MYGWIWRHLPGPRWLRVLEAAVLAVAVVLLLFEVVFPWASTTFGLSGNANVGQ